MQLDFKFSSEVAEKVFLSSKRILVWVSGYNSGKTWTLCQKFIFLLLTFPGYRAAFFRSNATDLKRTTKQTFLKVCPPELIAQNIEGPVPETILINGSRIYWLWIDHTNVDSIKSLEINGALYDQAEKLIESVFDAIDARVGRWEDVTIPPELINFVPRNEFTGKPEPPAYFGLLLNPPDEGEVHFCYSTLEPKGDSSIVKKETLWMQKENSRVAFFESSALCNKAINKENLATLMARDQEFIDRFVHGKRGFGEGAIHNVRQESIISPSDPNFDKLIERIKRKAALVRTFDYGATSPSCMIWWAALDGIHIGFREYYMPDKVISFHRREIALLSGNEYYIGNYADPSIFARDQEKKGGRYSLADNYSDEDVYSLKPGDAPPILFTPADNNEFATRDRINELLIPSQRNIHPLTGLSPAPAIYFIQQDSELYPHGCFHLIRQTRAQKKMLLDTINGKSIYSDERDDTIEDHAYDNLRYYVSVHQNMPLEIERREDPNSFKAILKRIKARKIYEGAA